MSSSPVCQLVWYVCYGSNLCYERLMCYLTGNGSEKYQIAAKPDGRCSNQNPPERSKVIAIPFPTYFARKSSTWQNGGVAFLDPTRKGVSVGRAYLVTTQQLDHIKRREGSWYQNELYLGDIEGIPALTLTDFSREPSVEPSPLYRQVLLDGLLECGIPKSFAESYLSIVAKEG